jgi:hypothetical protein
MIAAGIGILATLLIWGAQSLHKDEPPPQPEPTPNISPLKQPRRPFREAAFQPQEGGKVSPDGKEEITCDLPQSEKKRNIGGRDGAGLCVFTSIEYAARWQNERGLINFQKQMSQERGGGYPQKVDKMIKKYAPGTQYIQKEDGDMEFLRAALKTGRMPCVTYNGHDCHYRGGISHMVTLVHLSDTWACIGDNNFTGDSQYVWMSPSEFKRRWGGDGAWCVVLLHPSPSPVPHNTRRLNVPNLSFNAAFNGIAPYGY